MRVSTRLILKIILSLVPMAASPSDYAPTGFSDPVLARGEYLVYIAGCHACHTDHRKQGVFLAGGAEIVTPFGQFFPPNITPDVQTGIGDWTDTMFINAMQRGQAPDGHRYYPVFPYTSYSRLRTDDVLAIKRYLDQLSPVQQPRQRHQLKGLARLPGLLPLWQALYLRPDWSAVAESADPQLRSGAYLVEAVGHCGECHSVRDVLGGTRYRDWLRGAKLASGHHATNLSPHPDGLAAWESDELVQYLHSGRTDMGAKAHHEMREFVDHASRYLTEPDRVAIASYLFALPPRTDGSSCRQIGPRVQTCRTR